MAGQIISSAIKIATWYLLGYSSPKNVFTTILPLWWLNIYFSFENPTKRTPGRKLRDKGKSKTQKVRFEIISIHESRNLI